MVRRSVLVLAILATAGGAHAQAPPLIDRIDEATLDRIAADLHFKRNPAPIGGQVQCQKRNELPRPCEPSELPPGFKPNDTVKEYKPSQAGVYRSFRTPEGLTVSAAGIDCHVEGKSTVCDAVQFASGVRISKELRVADFVEVFNNTHPSVRLVTNGGGLLCQRYVLVKGGVTAENLRLILKDFAEVALSLKED